MENERIIKEMLETWISRNGCCFVDEYNFIRDDGSHYTVSTIEKDREDNVFISIYWVEINECSCKIIEMA